MKKISTFGVRMEHEALFGQMMFFQSTVVNNCEIFHSNPQPMNYRSREGEILFRLDKHLFSIYHLGRHQIRIAQFTSKAILLTLQEDENFITYRIFYQSQHLIFDYLSTIRPVIQLQDNRKPWKNLGIFNKGGAPLLMVVLGNTLQVYNASTNQLLVKVQLCQHMITVDNIVFDSQHDLVLIWGKNFHETFSVLQLVKIFDHYWGDDNMIYMSKNTCKNWALSITGMFDRYIETDTLLYNRLVNNEQEKLEESGFWHDDYHEITHADFFTRKGNPYLVLGNTKTQSIYMIDLKTLLYIEKFKLAPAYFHRDSIQEITPIPAILAMFTCINFKMLKCHQSKDVQNLVIQTTRENDIVYRITESFNLVQNLTPYSNNSPVDDQKENIPQ